MKQKNSITRRFMMYLIAIIILSNIIVSGVNYFITVEHTRQQTINISQDLLKSHLSFMERYFSDIDNLASSIIYNEKVIQFLKTDVDTNNGINIINTIESLYYNSRPDLQLTFFKVNDPNNMYTIVKGESGTAIQDYRYSQWYQNLVWVDESKIYIENVTEDDNTQFVQSVVYKVEDLYDDNIVGYLKIDMDLNELKKYFMNDYSGVSGVAIMNEEWKVLFYDKTLVEIPDEIIKGDDQGIFENDDYIMSYGISESTGWHMCIVMSKKEIFQGQNEIISILIGVVCFIILFTVMISNKCFAVITENFKRLIDGMERVKRGDLTTQVIEKNQDEISVLINEFNDMMIRVNNLMKTVEAKQLLLKEAEIKALQQQINPHFIFNIMETIMGLASEGMDDEVIEVSQCMSSMLRYNTRFENITQIKEELKQINNYVNIMKIRFEDRFEAFFDIDESCLDCNIVKFTLQPLVENAISHGLRETYSDGMLRIRIKKEDDNISIMIFDNGIGISQENLKELNRRFRDTSERPLDYIEQYKSLGLLNVYLRMKIYYGSKFLMEIFSKEKKGTCIAITIPFVKDGGEQNVSGNDS